MKIDITKATIANVLELQVVGKATFYETFAQANTKDDMDKYLDENFTIEKLSEEINNSESFFYMAKIDGFIVAYLKLNIGNAQTEQIIENALEIERIYVLEPFQGLNIGSLLYNKAKEVALNNKLKHIWLGVWEKNEKAIRFYQKMGFEPFSKHIFKLGDDEQTDILLKLDL